MSGWAHCPGLNLAEGCCGSTDAGGVDVSLEDSGEKVLAGDDVAVEEASPAPPARRPPALPTSPVVIVTRRGSPCDLYCKLSPNLALQPLSQLYTNCLWRRQLEVCDVYTGEDRVRAATSGAD